MTCLRRPFICNPVVNSFSYQHSLVSQANMGLFGSSEENVEETMIDTNGHVNNNIIIQEAKDTHLQAATSERLLIATYVLIGIEVLKLTLCTYNMWKRQLKRKYGENNEPRTNP